MMISEMSVDPSWGALSKRYFAIWHVVPSFIWVYLHWMQIIFTSSRSFVCFLHRQLSLGISLSDLIYRSNFLCQLTHQVIHWRSAPWDHAYSAYCATSSKFKKSWCRWFHNGCFPFKSSARLGLHKKIIRFSFWRHSQEKRLMASRMCGGLLVYLLLRLRLVVIWLRSRVLLWKIYPTCHP